MIKKNKLFLLMLSVIVLVGCDANGVYDEYQNLPENQWNLETPIQFSFKPTDTISKRNLFINIRNNNKYSFSNLYLITHLYFPDGNKIVDTLQYEMADKNGRFLGDGLSEIKDNKLFYKEKVQFPVFGNYKLNIFQAMRKNNQVNGIENLQGITDVGFRIEKIN